MGSLIRMNVMGGFVAFYLVHLGVVPTLISYPACSNEPYWIVFQSRNRPPAADAVFYRKLQPPLWAEIRSVYHPKVVPPPIRRVQTPE